MIAGQVSSTIEFFRFEAKYPCSEILAGYNSGCVTNLAIFDAGK